MMHQTKLAAVNFRRPIAGLLGFLGALIFYSPEARADRVESVRVWLHEGNVEKAQGKCNSWNVQEPGSDPKLREVCAQAMWRTIEAVDDYQGWREFREVWVGTTWADLAIGREASARVGGLDPSLSEAELVSLAELYKETDSHGAYLEQAANAAYRDVKDGEDAVRVVRTWSDHTGVVDLVHRFPASFLEIEVDERTVEARLIEGVKLENPPEVSWKWLAQNASGDLGDWDSTVVTILTDWGVQHEVVSSLPTGTGLARLPICDLGPLAETWKPVLQVTVGEVSFLHPLEKDESCSAQSWPVFLSHREGRAVGISLRPGHRVDLRSTGNSGDIRDLVKGVRVGDVVLGPDGIYQQHAAIQVVQPLSGGAAWTTLRSAGQWSQPLGEGLHKDPIPEGWELVPHEDEFQVRSEALAKMPPALRQWRLVGGEVSVIPLQMRAVIGMTLARATPDTPPAPRMTPNSGWVRTAAQGVEPTPPKGATIAGLSTINETELQVAEGILAAMSITDESLFIIDGWKADLDRDRVEETILRAGIEGNGVVFVLDPVTPDRALAADNCRVFGWTTPSVGTEGQEISTPFPFQKAGYTYLAWISSSAEGVGMEVIRVDGTGFTRDRFMMP